MAMPTVRESLIGALHLPETVGAQLHPGGSTQWKALRGGQAVEFTREQVLSLCPPNQRPANVEAFATWTLNANDTWTGS